MKNTSIGNFTRGGQIMTHQMRMFGQGLRASFLFGIGGSLSWGLWQIGRHLNPQDLYYWSVAYWASFKLDLLSLFYGPQASWKTDITFYHSGLKKWHTFKAVTYLNWSVIKGCISRVEKGFNWLLSMDFLGELIVAFLLGISLSIIIFAHKGWKKHQRKFERGGHFVSPRALTASLKKQNQDSDIKFDGLPIIRNSETIHMMFSGTTGSGKTNALHKLLPQIRKKGQKAIIVDLNGTFVSNYYREGKDIILNPLDKRTHPWSPWADCHTTPQYDAFAEAMIPSGNVNDPFWDRSANTVFAAALEKLKDSKKTTELCRLLLGADLHELSGFFKKTSAGKLIEGSTDRMSLSVLATLSNQIKCLLYVQDTEVPFSIRNWLKQEDDSWLFLTAAPDQRATLQPLIATWLDIAFNGLMSADPEKGNDLNKRVWFILDELPALQKIPSLQTALAESRKFGGCVVAGIQNIHQLQNIYGQAQSQAIMNLFNTSFIFRTEDPETCRYLSSKLGEQELHDVQENISYGANTMRDGVNLNVNQKRHTLVLPTEISLLPNLECFVKYPGTWPITRLQMKLERPKPIVSAFQIQEIKTKISYEKSPPNGESEIYSKEQNIPTSSEKKKPEKKRVKENILIDL